VAIVERLAPTDAGEPRRANAPRQAQRCEADVFSGSVQQAKARDSREHHPSDVRAGNELRLVVDVLARYVQRCLEGRS